MADRALRVSAFDVPTTSPEADGTFEWSHTVLVTVELQREGVIGFGYTYADVATAHFACEHLAPVALSCDLAAPAQAYAAMGRAVRNVGREGVAATAISAVDMALWDARAQLLCVPLVRLLGARRTGVEAYGSGGFTSYSTPELQAQLAEWREQGFRRVKMKIGDEPTTAARVRAGRAAVGDIELFVDANGAYSPRRALAVAGAIADCGVTWFEEPVSSDDLEGLRFVRERAPAAMAIAAGEYGYRDRYFDRMLSAGAVDVLQADATRCGVTGFLGAAALCEGRGVALSAHCAPTVHAHLGCAAPNVVHVEYFHDHARIERMFFDGFVEAAAGVLRPDLSRPGLGVRLKRRDAAPFQVFDHDCPAEGR